MEWWSNQCKALGQVMQGSFLGRAIRERAKGWQIEKVVHPNHPDVGGSPASRNCPRKEVASVSSGIQATLLFCTATVEQVLVRKPWTLQWERCFLAASRPIFHSWRRKPRKEKQKDTREIEWNMAAKFMGLWKHIFRCVSTFCYGMSIFSSTDDFWWNIRWWCIQKAHARWV